MRIAEQLTENVEIGAVRVHTQDGLEVVTTDGGKEVRNLRAANEARTWEVAIPMVDIESSNTADYDSVLRMWQITERGLHTFDFRDFIDGDLAEVRFASPIQVTAPAGHLRHIDTFTIKEVIGE